MPQSPQASKIRHARSWALKYRGKKNLCLGQRIIQLFIRARSWGGCLQAKHWKRRESSVWCLWPCREQPLCFLFQAFVTNSQGTLPSRGIQPDLPGNSAQHMNDPRRLHFYQPRLGSDNLGKSARAFIRPLLLSPPLVRSKASLPSHHQPCRFSPSSKIQSESKCF